MNLAKQDWVTLYGEGNFPQPEGDSFGWRFEFPREGSVNYVTTRERFKNRPRPERLVISYAIAATPNAEWKALGRKGREGLEPNFRPILLANMGGELGRWWHGRCVFLENGSGSVSWDLNPAEWTSVFSTPADTDDTTRRAFRNAVSQARFGVTFGGGNAYGHGVRLVSGRASFRIKKFRFL